MTLGRVGGEMDLEVFRPKSGLDYFSLHWGATPVGLTLLIELVNLDEALSF